MNPNDNGGLPPQQPQPLHQPSPPPDGYPAQPQPVQTPQPVYQGPLQPQLPPLHIQNRPLDTPVKSDGTPYDFFMEPQHGAKKPRGARGMSGFAKLLIGAAIFGVVLIVLAVILSASRSGKNTPAIGLTAIAQQQQEIIRISTVATPEVTSQSLQNFTVTAISATTSTQKELVTYINKHGGKVGPKQLALGVNPKTDQVLNAAQAASTFDATYQTVMQQMLTDYQVKVQQTHDAALGQSERDLLDNDLSSAKLLLQMLSQ